MKVAPLLWRLSPGSQCGVGLGLCVPGGEADAPCALRGL